MIELHPVTLADKAWIDPIVLAENSPSADYNFGNIFLWDEAYHQQVGRLAERMIVRLTYEHRPFFAWPIGTGDLVPALKEMGAFVAAQDIPLVIRGVTADHLEQLRALYGDSFAVEEERGLWDYLYTAEKLDTLAGKHLHGKRNHIHRFEQENRWHFSPLSQEDFPACQALLDRWLEQRGEEERAGVADEHRAIERAFANYSALDLTGGALWVGEELAAFTMGEMTSRDTFDVHFEKADSDVDGAFSMINREFVRLVRAQYPQVVWINREDDTGQPSLRQAKLSYHPDRMVEKYKVELAHV